MLEVGNIRHILEGQDLVMGNFFHIFISYWARDKKLFKPQFTRMPNVLLPRYELADLLNYNHLSAFV
jgi:hypothetical protein